jgi:hypothetical protein
MLKYLVKRREFSKVTAFSYINSNFIIVFSWVTQSEPSMDLQGTTEPFNSRYRAFFDRYPYMAVITVKGGSQSGSGLK